MTRDLSTNKATMLIIVVPILGLAAGAAVAATLRLGGAPAGNLVANVCFLTAILTVVAIMRFSRADLGLRLIPGWLRWHVVASSTVLGLYALFYLLAIRVSDVKPFSPEVVWGLAAYGVVAVAEELYFRGALYGFLERRYSPRVALVTTSLLFGLFHARQGGAAIARVFTGWLWGSVRYSSGMIHLLIPIHFVYNATALIFEGAWAEPPIWGVLLLPAAEFLLGLVLIIVRRR